LTSKYENEGHRIPINKRESEHTNNHAHAENGLQEEHSAPSGFAEAHEGRADEKDRDMTELLAEKEKEAKDNYDKYLRSMAEFENFKKRQVREKAEFLKMANESLIRELLPVKDSLDRALEQAANSDVPKSYIEGIELARKSFMDVLAKNGLTPIEALGEKFDPNYHEAIMQQEDPDVDENTVITQVHQGFMLNDKLLRPAMVVVSKKPAQEE